MQSVSPANDPSIRVPGRSWVRRAVWGLLFLVALGARLAFMDSYATDLPYLDQWDVEGRDLYIPYAEGSLEPAALVRIFNAHRIFFTRITALGLWVANGQWDNRLQMVVATGIYLLAAILVCRALWSVLGRRHLVPLALCFGLITAAPFAWENTLWGFQSQIYYCTVFSFGGLYFTLNSRPFRVAWFGGICLLTAALFSFGSGAFAALAVVPALLVRAVVEPERRRDSIVSGAAGLVIGMGGILLQQSTVHATDIYWRNAMVSLAKHLAWPFVDAPCMALVVWLPALLLATGYVWRRIENTQAAALSIAAMGWCFLNALSFVVVAIMRNEQNGGGPSSRYMDTLALALPLNAMAALALMEQAWRRGGRSASWWIWGWLAIMGYGVLNLAFEDSGAAREQWHTRDQPRQIQAVRNFVRTDDPACLPPYDWNIPWDRPIPFFDAAELARILRHPVIRKTLPLSVRASIPLLPVSGADSSFVRDRTDSRCPARTDQLPVWSSYGVEPQAGFSSAVCEPGHLPYLVIEYTGFPNRSRGVGLRLVGADGTWSRDVTPRKIAWKKWEKLVVRQPQTPYRVEAYDRESDYLWFAFTEAREWGRGSRWADALIRAGLGILLFSASMALAALMLVVSGAADAASRTDSLSPG